MDFVTVDFDRQVQVPVKATRRAVVAALADLGFEIDRAQGAALEAHRGSLLKVGFGGPRPVRIAASVMGHNGTARVHVHLGDAAPAPMKPGFARNVYQPLFTEIQETLDAHLLAVDPALAPDPLPPIEMHEDTRPGLRGQVGNLVKGLPGPVRTTATRALRDRTYLWLRGDERSAVLSPDEAEMMMTVGSLVAADPEALPPAMHRRLEDLTVAMGRAVAEASPPAAELVLSREDEPAADFLYQQSVIRQQVALREVHTCRDCGFSRIVNPDYQHQVTKNRWLADAIGMVGLTVSPAGVNPFLVFGRLFNLNAFRKQLEVCRRCEGVDMDVNLAAICPECRTILTATILRRCPHKGCPHDFLASIAGCSLWTGAMRERANRARAPRQPAATPVSTDPPAGVPAAATPAAGWYPDPAARHQLRWFDGSWTPWVSDAGTTAADPLA